MRGERRQRYNNDHRYGHRNVNCALAVFRQIKALEGYSGPQPQEMDRCPNKVEDDEFDRDLEIWLIGKKRESCKERSVHSVGLRVHGLKKNAALDAGRCRAFDEGKS